MKIYQKKEALIGDLSHSSCSLDDDDDDDDDDKSN